LGSMTEFGTSSTKLPNGERREIRIGITMENLHKVGGSLKRLRQAETLLWQGKLMRQRLCLLIAPLNKLRILSTTSTSTVTASSPVLPGRTDLFDWLWGGRISRQTN